MSILHQFRGSQGGFGLQSYNRARAAGINPIHIANAIGSSGMPPRLASTRCNHP